MTIIAVILLFCRFGVCREVVSWDSTHAALTVNFPPISGLQVKLVPDPPLFSGGRIAASESDSTTSGAFWGDWAVPVAVTVGSGLIIYTIYTVRGKK